ncbi:MAG: glycosyltransferase family 9 protein, partial [Nanoarchaeota archaeon]
MMVVIRFIDKYLGNLICNFLGFFNRKNANSKKDYRKILVVQLWGIGETILTLPSIEALRKNFPKADMGVLATSRNKDVFFNNQNISNLKIIKLNPFSLAGFIFRNLKKYDLVVDMEEYLNVSAIISFFAGKEIVGYSHGSRAKLYDYKVKYNDKQHVVQTFLDLVRKINIIYGTNELPKLQYSKTDENKVNKFLKNNKIKNNYFIIVVAPGAAESAKSRMWPFNRYATLCDELIEKYNAKIVFTGTPDENNLIKSIQDKMEKKE